MPSVPDSEHGFAIIGADPASEKMIAGAVTLLRPFLESISAQISILLKSVQPEEVGEFADGARELFHRHIDLMFRPDSLPSAGELFLRDLMNYFESWALSMRLSANAEWLAQMEESEVTASEPPITVGELRNRLSA